MAAPSLHEQHHHYQPTKFFVGHYDSKRTYHVDANTLLAAQDAGFDTVSTSITNNAYQVHVLSQLSNYLSFLEDAEINSSNTLVHRAYAPPAPKLAPLTASHTLLSPKDPIASLLLQTSAWIDVASPDPVIADISRQVLKHEIEYAAFCGATNVLVYGPRRYNDEGSLARYAHALRNALSIGVFVNIHVVLPMGGSYTNQMDMGDLARFVREDFRDPVNSIQEPHVLESWEVWNLTRSICRYHSRLGVALIVPRHTPAPFVQSRWFSELPRMLLIPGESFIPNAKGNNVLSKGNQTLINRFMRLKNPPWILLGDVEPIPGYEAESPQPSSKDKGKSHRRFGSKSVVLQANEGMPKLTQEPTPAEASQSVPFLKKQPASEPHINYIRQHLERNQPERSTLDRFAAGFQDYLQIPLQPLSDNLESLTYECFETDPIKYEWYEQAIARTLRDWRAVGKEGSGPSGQITIAVVGAGRGPLVTRALRASSTTGIDVDVWAVEKNPSAFVVLQRQNEEEWGHSVNLVQSDMRSWKGPIYYIPTGKQDSKGHHDSEEELYGYDDDDDDGEEGESDDDGDARAETRSVDILVSELLGSFADNELSPECIDGVQLVLNPRHGVSIPSSYTAHLTPISAPGIHASIMARVESGFSEAFQLPYVVMLQGTDYLSTLDPSFTSASSTPLLGKKTIEHEPIPVVKQVWEFTHPVPNYILKQIAEEDPADRNNHNARHSVLTFECKNRGVCHGLGGYFETILYEKPADCIDGLGWSSVMQDEVVSESEGRSARKPAVNGKAAGAAAGDANISSSDKVELSTNPLTMANKSKDMLSWFPIYFPLKEPIQIPDNSELDISIWRQTDGRRVWFEWMVEAFVVMKDVTGRPKRMRSGMTELHSSEKNACLM